MTEKIKLPNGWAQVELGFFMKTGTGSVDPSKYKDEVFELYSIPFYDTGKPEILKGEKIGSSKKIVSENDVLLSRIVPHIQRSWIVGPYQGYRQIGSGEWIVFDGTSINPKYLRCFLLSYNFHMKFMTTISGVGGSLTRANPNLTAKFSILIPPLKEQDRIVEKLDELLSELEKGKEQLQTSLEQLKVYRQSILKHAFEGKLSEEWRKKQNKLKTPDELVAEIKAYRKQQYEKQLKDYKAGKIKVKPKEPRDFAPVSKKLSENFKPIPSTWFWTQINEISDNIAYGYTEKSTKEKIGPKFLRITDIQDNAVNWSTVPYCKIDREKVGQYLLAKGDLVFARTGATVGKSFLIRNDPPDAVYASYLIRIRIYKIFIPEFMAYYFQSDFYWKQITEGQVGIGQPNVNGSKLAELFIPLMSQEEQKEIVELLDNSMSNCDQLERTIIENINSVEVVKQGLLQKAFEGKLVEQDPTDEPASILLERIKKEREEFLKAEEKRKKTEKPLHIKSRKMAEELKRIIEILKESKEPVSAKTLWQSSTHKDDIDEFYAALKKHIEAGEIVEVLPRKGKESLLKLADTK